MKITQVRNATIIVEFAGKRFLVDPMLAEKGAYAGLPGSHNNHLRNPLVDLPMPLDQIINVDAVIVTHTHNDHWDEAARTALPKTIPLFAQNEKDAHSFRDAGFVDVRVLDETTQFEGVQLAKTPGKHGTDAAYAVVGDRLGEVCGVVFDHKSEKTTYLAGDTVLNDFVRDTIAKYQPEIIILNSGDAYLAGLDPILMGKEDVAVVAELAPKATLMATHLEGVNLTRLTRSELREFAALNKFSDRLLIPADGEVVNL